MGKLAKLYNVTGATSIAEVLSESGTGFEVEMVPAVLAGSTDHGGFHAVRRSDTGLPLAFATERYAINQHTEQLGAIAPLVDNGTLLPFNVAVWDNASMIAYQFGVPALDVLVGGADKVRQLLTLIFSYNGKASDLAFFAGFRAFCSNQMGKFYAMADQRIRHKGNASAAYADLLSMRIGEIGEENVARAALMTRMAETPLSGRELVQYVGRSLDCNDAAIDAAYTVAPENLKGDAARIPEVLECYAVDDCGAKGTVWQAYNAVTRYTTHGKTGSQKGTPAGRLRSILGAATNRDGMVRSKLAWDNAVKLVEPSALMLTA